MGNKTALKQHFPMLRDREEILQEITKSNRLSRLYATWVPECKEEFLDFCTGARGMKILYDSFFKEALNCEYDVGRLEFFLSTVLKRKVKILKILPNDSTRIADETSLLITDIVVELEDGSLANVEIQKIGYAFPGTRCACYSSDMLLRQYKRLRAREGDSFSYNHIKNVYLIVIYEKSPAEFKALPNVWYHRAKQQFDSGLQMELLQEYIMIPLDIFKKCMQNKNIETELEAWLTFLGSDSPERIIELITAYPQFKAMYETLYSMCLNTERVMEMFSEELRRLDRNTVKYMIDEQQKQIDEQQQQIDEQVQTLQKQIEQLNEQSLQLDAQREQLFEQNQRLNAQRAQLSKQNQQLDAQKAQLSEQNQRLNAQRAQLSEQNQRLDAQRIQLSEQNQQLKDKDLEIETLRKRIAELEK